VQLGKFVVYARDNRGCRLFVGGAKCEVEVLAPSGRPVTTPVSIVDNDDSTYSVVYRPETPGWYTITIKLNNGNIKTSPHRVLLHELNFAKLEALGLIFEPTDASKSIAYGKGLQGKQALDRTGKLKEMVASVCIAQQEPDTTTTTTTTTRITTTTTIIVTHWWFGDGCDIVYRTSS
jgi:uncharacterized protein Veg